jgi:excinuclease ABC subunit B
VTGGPEEIRKAIVQLEEEMLVAADELRFEHAARLRDELRDLQRQLDGMEAAGLRPAG